MAILKDKLFIAGGAVDNDVVLNDVSVLNTATGKWQSYSKMPTAKYNATAIGHQSMLIVVGGVTPTKGLI